MEKTGSFTTTQPMKRTGLETLKEDLSSFGHKKTQFHRKSKDTKTAPFLLSLWMGLFLWRESELEKKPILIHSMD